MGIDVQDTRTAASSFLRSDGVTYPSGFDASGAVNDAFAMDGTPTMYFISDGRIVDLHVGALTERALLALVQQVFGIPSDVPTRPDRSARSSLFTSRTCRARISDRCDRFRLPALQGCRSS